MDNRHTTSLFLAWFEGTTTERARIDEHLRQCSACRTYFEKMSAMLAPLPENAIPLPRLAADPYLATRIAAGERERRAGARSAHLGWKQWSLASIGATLAIAIGIFLGAGLPGNRQQAATTSDEDLLRTYYDAISQQSFSARFESVAEETTGEQP